MEAAALQVIEMEEREFVFTEKWDKDGDTISMEEEHKGENLEPVSSARNIVTPATMHWPISENGKSSFVLKDEIHTYYKEMLVQ